MNKKRSPQARATLGLLAALAATNAIFLILLRTGGPLIGLVVYGLLLALAWRGRPHDYHKVVIGGLIGLAIHIAEVVLIGWTAYPALMVLNLILPAVLASVAWSEVREE